MSLAPSTTGKESVQAVSSISCHRCCSCGESINKVWEKERKVYIHSCCLSIQFYPSSYVLIFPRVWYDPLCSLVLCHSAFSFMAQFSLRRWNSFQWKFTPSYSPFPSNVVSMETYKDTCLSLCLWVQESSVQMSVSFQGFASMFFSLPASGPSTLGQLRLPAVIEARWSTCWSVVLSRLGGCVVWHCPGVKTERSVLSTWQPLCWSCSSAESEGGRARTCGRWWKPTGPRWGWGRRSGKLWGSRCHCRTDEWRW